MLNNTQFQAGNNILKNYQLFHENHNFSTFSKTPQNFLDTVEIELEFGIFFIY